MKVEMCEMIAHGVYTYLTTFPVTFGPGPGWIAKIHLDPENH